MRFNVVSISLWSDTEASRRYLWNFVACREQAKFRVILAPFGLALLQSIVGYWTASEL